MSLSIRRFLIVFLPLHQFVEAVPQRRNGLVFACHAQHFFKFPVEIIAAWKELLESLINMSEFNLGLDTMVTSTALPTAVISTVSRLRSRSK